MMGEENFSLTLQAGFVRLC